jgi:H+-translocating NAD(P) transhydrogenase subunit alpha
MTGEVLIGFYTFVLACVAGYQLITKVPPTLHTPLMSGANAISGVTILGALAMARVSGDHAFGVATVLGMLAVIFATINVVGGFAVTERMLAMFGSKKPAKEGK